MKTKDKLDELIEKGDALIDRLLAKMDSKPKYLLVYTLSDKYKIESLEERLITWGFQKTERGVWISNEIKDCMKTKDFITLLKRTKKFVLAKEGKIVLVINENNKREEIVI